MSNKEILLLILSFIVGAGIYAIWGFSGIAGFAIGYILCIIWNKYI